MKLSVSDGDLSTAAWHKSSYSGASGGDCVEVLGGLPGVVPVRDSKVTDSPALLFRTAAWGPFVADLKRGRAEPGPGSGADGEAGREADAAPPLEALSALSEPGARL